MTAKECSGPGYPTPLAATKGPQEKLLYVTCVNCQKAKDILATVDVDPESETYGKVIHQLEMPSNGDELHHSGWNACSSCNNDCKKKRDKLILPCLVSDRIYIVDTTNERKPEIFKIIEAKDLHDKNAGAPHTSHCLPNGKVMVSCMGDRLENAQGSFLTLDGIEGILKVEKATNLVTDFGYDFWYQPRQNVLVSSKWGAPGSFRKGFDPQDIANGKYGNSLTFWNYKEMKIEETIYLGQDGLMPLEVRFLHNPDKASGFVGCALNSNVFYFYKKDERWKASNVISIPAVPVTNWVLPEISALITDILISMDDKYLYFSNWLQGDIRQYDISDPFNPKLKGQIFVGGLLCSDSNAKPAAGFEQKERPVIKNRQLKGGPQMLQLSLDGKRLYVTDSLFSRWDEQFYPELLKDGSTMIQINVNTDTGGLQINPDFIVDFGTLENGPFLAHEMRYPGGDCTSDIWE